jgi:hypothetical protein
VSADANYIAIDGWWAQCGDENDALNGLGCKGDLTAVEPMPIDVTGNTCYINPSRVNIEGIEHMVYWFSTQESSDGIVNAVVYHSWYMPFADVDQYFPPECTTGGACFCGAFEQLRTGWNLTDSTGCSGTGAIDMPETHGCVSGGFQPLESSLTETTCAYKKNLFREYSEVTPSLTYTINGCALAASFTSLAPSTVSPAPSQAPSIAPSSALSGATTGIGMTLSAALVTALFYW